MFEWLPFAANGIALASSVSGLHAWITGFALARQVDDIKDEVTLLNGQMLRVLDGLTRIADRHYGTNTLGVELGGASVIQPVDSRHLRRPAGLSVDYITECETAVDPALSAAFLATPSDFLHDICIFGDSVPTEASLRDDSLIPWHFEEDGQHKIGFTKRGYLDHLGIRYTALADAAPAAATVAERDPPAPSVPTRFPRVARRFDEVAGDAFRIASSFARITAYSDDPDFRGMHSYHADCPHCGSRNPLPRALYVGRYHRLRCAHCTVTFAAEFVRTNISLRYHGGWTIRKD